jgi:hypothetical protein
MPFYTTKWVADGYKLLIRQGRRRFHVSQGTISPRESMGTPPEETKLIPDLLKSGHPGQVLEAHAYNPSYSGGRDQEDKSSKPAHANSSRDPISIKPITNRIDGVAQVVEHHGERP